MSDAAPHGLGPRDLVFCAGTLLKGSLRDIVAAASAGGFRAVSLWPHHVAGARAEGLRDADVRSLLDDHGLAPLEIEPLLSWLPDGALAPEHARLVGPPPRDFFDLALALGAPTVLAVDGFGARAELDAIAGAFGTLCDGAAERGLRVKLEFTPWSAIPDARTAAEVVRRAGRPNAGILIDAWHHFRGANDLAQIAALPGAIVQGVQLGDAPAARTAETLPEEAMHARRLPGEGDIDLVGLVRTLDAIGSRAPIGVEVFSDDLERRPAEEVGRVSADALRALLAEARASAVSGSGRATQ